MSKSTVDQPWASAMGLGLRAAGFRHSGSKRPADDRRLKVWGNLNQWLGRGFGLISHLIRFIQVSGPRGQKVASMFGFLVGDWGCRDTEPINKNDGAPL